MNTTDVCDLLPPLLASAGLPDDPKREALRVWAHSGVERLRFDDGASVVFKYADAPFDTEHVALRLAASNDVPVPALRAARTTRRSPPPLEHADTTRDNPSRCGRLGQPSTTDSESHPTSLHISDSGWRLLDFARAFIGPGLLDLASWHGTLDDPQPEHTLDLIESYVASGGAPQALAMRGGLDAASWALGWHRVWAVDWFAEQIERGWARGAEDSWSTAIRRHLGEACTLLKA